MKFLKLLLMFCEVMIVENEFQFIIYNLGVDNESANVRIVEDTIWMTQNALAELFGIDRTGVGRHLKNIFEEGELDKEVVCANFSHTTKHGAIEGKEQVRDLKYYNLDAIISVGYRINSKKATAFRIWATKVLKEYMIKGFAMDDDRLKQGTSLFGNDYFKELLERIRDIRSSEKIFYRQVLDLFATSIDYDGNSEEAKKFFATVQNKMHYAIHQKTASELIFDRVDGDKEFMGLTTFKGELPTLTEAKTAKNYLSEKELCGLNQLVSGYLDFAERQAEREVAMTMADWIKYVDSILQATGEDVLENVGKVSYKQMEKKVLEEYKKYSAQTLTPVEKEYLKEIKNITTIAKEGNN